MKRYRGWIVLFIFVVICSGGIWLTLQLTAEYPTLGEQVSYPVNQVEGFELTIEEPSWSPFRGYSIRWKVKADSEDVYYFIEDGEAPTPLNILNTMLMGNGIGWDIHRTTSPLQRLNLHWVEKKALL